MLSLRHRRAFLWGSLVLLVYLVAFEVAIPLVQLKRVWYFQAWQQQQNETSVRRQEREHNETLVSLDFLQNLWNITNNQETVAASNSSDHTAQNVSMSSNCTLITEPRPREGHGAPRRSPKSFLAAKKKVALVQSVPYPYRHIGAGPTEAVCKWRTFDMKPAKGQYVKWKASLQQWWPSLPTYLLAPDVLTTKKNHKPPPSASQREVLSTKRKPSWTVNAPLDVIQTAAIREGICVPNAKSPTSSATSAVQAWDNLHVFSAMEARRCLAYAPSRDRSRRRRLLITGDSYTRQLFIGIHDIVMAQPSNEEILDGSQRRRMTLDIREKLVQRFVESTNPKKGSSPSTFPEIDFVCFDECYGSNMTRSFALACSSCLKKLRYIKKVKGKISRKLNAVENVIVVGVGIHLVNAFSRNAGKAREELELFMNKTSSLPIVLVSMPSFDKKKVPLEHRHAADRLSAASRGPRPMYEGFLEMAARHEVPVLDFFQLTRSCVAKNCSYDGGHRSRYVNRWKAQLLLNLLCEVKVSPAAA
jgi:hypothetical protein